MRYWIIAVLGVTLVFLGSSYLETADGWDLMWYCLCLGMICLEVDNDNPVVMGRA